MLSKEEILGRPEFLPRDNVPDYLRTMYDPKKVLAAMDEYAKQEAIGFSKWKEKNNWWCEEFEDDGVTRLKEITWSNDSVLPQNITTDQLYLKFKDDAPK